MRNDEREALSIFGGQALLFDGHLKGWLKHIFKLTFQILRT